MESKVTKFITKLDHQIKRNAGLGNTVLKKKKVFTLSRKVLVFCLRYHLQQPHVFGSVGDWTACIHPYGWGQAVFRKLQRLDSLRKCEQNVSEIA